MLLLSEKLVNVPIMSLQTGGALARTAQAIVDPRTLVIPALYVTGDAIEPSPAVLHTADIRETGSLGFIVDDSSKLMSLDGLVRLQEIIDFHFDIMSCHVYDRSGSKLGHVTDYSFDPLSFSIEQIYVKRPFLRSLTATSHIINRAQIVSVTPDRIVVDSPTITVRSTDTTDNTMFVNPFRTHAPQPDQVRVEQAD